MTNHIRLTYCTRYRRLLRSAWMAQELPSTFDVDIAELTLKPGTVGIFEACANNRPV